MHLDDRHEAPAAPGHCPAYDGDGAEPARRLSHQADKAALLNRLRRIEGQVRGLHRMVEADRYCVDVLVQIAAVKAAIDRVALELVESHLRGCVQDAIGRGEGELSIRELMEVLKGLLRQG